MSVTYDAPECFARVPSHFRDLVEAGNGFHVTDHSRPHLLNGKWTAQRGHVLEEMVRIGGCRKGTVTRGFEMTHFKKKADQV